MDILLLSPDLYSKRIQQSRRAGGWRNRIVGAGVARSPFQEVSLDGDVLSGKIGALGLGALVCPLLRSHVMRLPILVGRGPVLGLIAFSNSNTVFDSLQLDYTAIMKQNSSR